MIYQMFSISSSHFEALTQVSWRWPFSVTRGGAKTTNFEELIFAQISHDSVSNYHMRAQSDLL